MNATTAIAITAITKMVPATLSLSRLSQCRAQTSVPPIDRRIPTGTIVRNNPAEWSKNRKWVPT